MTHSHYEISPIGKTGRYKVIRGEVLNKKKVAEFDTFEEALEYARSHDKKGWWSEDANHRL